MSDYTKKSLSFLFQNIKVAIQHRSDKTMSDFKASDCKIRRIDTLLAFVDTPKMLNSVDYNTLFKVLTNIFINTRISHY